MNINDVKNAFGRQTPGGYSNNDNKSLVWILLSLAVLGGLTYLGYKYWKKLDEPKNKMKTP